MKDNHSKENRLFVIIVEVKAILLKRALKKRDQGQGIIKHNSFFEQLTKKIKLGIEEEEVNIVVLLNQSPTADQGQDLILKNKKRRIVKVQAG